MYELERSIPLDQPYRNGDISNGTIPKQAAYQVFHQLLKIALFRLHRSGGDAVQELELKADQLSKKNIDGLTLDHQDHFIEYVRQGLMCVGDTTLEPAGLDDDRD